MSMAVYCQLNQQTRSFSTVMASELVESVSKHQIRLGIGRWAGRGGAGRLNPCRETKIPGLFMVHFFGSVQMVMVSKNHGYKWFAVMVLTLSRLEHGWFRRNSVCCGPVYGPWLSMRFGVRFTIPGEVCGAVSVRFAFNIFRPEVRHLPCLQL